MPTTQDRKHYLSDLIGLYKKQLDSPVATLWGDFIQQEKEQCIQELEQIRQVDMEATLLARKGNIKVLSSASHFPITSDI